MPTVGQRSRWSMCSRGKQTGWNHFDIWGLLKNNSKWNDSAYGQNLFIYTLWFLLKKHFRSLVSLIWLYLNWGLCANPGWPWVPCPMPCHLNVSSACGWALPEQTDATLSQWLSVKPCSLSPVQTHSLKSLLIVHREEKWLTKQGELSVMVCTSNPNNSQGWGRKILTLRLALATQRDLI